MFDMPPCQSGADGFPAFGRAAGLSRRDSSGRVTMGTAAEAANLSIPEFQRELGRRHIPVNYTAADLAQDLRAAAELARR